MMGKWSAIFFLILFYVFTESKETLPHELNFSAGLVLSLGSLSLESGLRSSPGEFGRERGLPSRTVAGNRAHDELSSFINVLYIGRLNSFWYL